jgi:hypothetical protein
MISGKTPASEFVPDYGNSVIDQALQEAGADAPRRFRATVDSIGDSGTREEWRELAQVAALRLDIYLAKGGELERSLSSIQRTAGLAASEMNRALKMSAVLQAEQREVIFNSVCRLLAEIAAVKPPSGPNVAKFPSGPES